MTPARQVHEDVIVLDTHLDTPALLIRPSFDIMARHDPALDYSQVDYPRMVEGGLDGGFWAIYTPQGPLTTDAYQAVRDTAILRAVAIHEMVASHPDVFELATRPEDAARIVGEGKRIVYMSIENSYPLGEDISLLKTFYDLGVRMVGPVHFRNNQFGDSSTDPDGQQWHGLSPLGKALVAKANSLGMVLDGSHAHDDVVRQMIDLSKTPIILSHSGVKAVFDHPRNIDDDLLRKLADSGGVIQINTYSSYLKKLPENPARREAFVELMKEVGSPDDLSEADYAKYIEKRREIDAKFPPEQADFEDFMAQLMHALSVVGPEHVGIGPDWDGGGGVHGMEDISALPRVTERLLAAGYTEADLENIWSGNVLRLLGTAEAYAASMRAGKEH
ncbi:MAG: dipeptidase [Pseudomonadales bacterium]|nr:dipeptidase [Pseudomonadales bacterium]